MKKICLYISVLVTTVGILVAAEDFQYPPTTSLEEISSWVRKAPTGHPRLLTDQRQLNGLADIAVEDPVRNVLKKAVIEQAHYLQEQPPITRTLQGRRLLGQSRRCLRRVVLLSTAFYLTGDLDYVRRCEKEMLAAARFSDWNPSHFLDVAEMTFALAIGYDWLHQRLDPSVRREVRDAIINKGVRLPFDTEHNRWVRSQNNWGQVCHGGLTAGALAVLEDEPELAARTVHNALHNVTNSMRAYSPKGSYPEGPGYWAYGTSYNVVLIAVLESVFETDFGLSKAPGFDQTGQYLSIMTGPSGYFFNYADGGSSRGPQPALFWLASRFGRPDWLFGERELLEARLGELKRKSATSESGRFLPFALLWMEAEDPETVRMPLHWQSKGDTEVAVHRSSWSDPQATYVGLKAGSPSANHGQMDTGSFVLDADGVRWAVDLGSEGYHGIESRGMDLWNRTQSSDRWTIFRQSNHGHNTLVLDNQLQKAAGRGKIVAFSDAPSFPYTIVDLSKVYEGQVESAERGVALVNSREVLIQDQLKGLNPGSKVRWGMITPGLVEAIDGSGVALRQGEARIKLEILVPQTVEWKVIDTEKPRNEWDSPNEGTKMIAFESVAPESGDLILAVLATPGTVERSTVDEFDVRPFKSWGQ